MVTIDVRHDGLGRFERVSAPNRIVAEARAAALSQFWNDQFARRSAALARPGINPIEVLKKLEADERTEEAERARSAITSILINTVRATPMPDWSPLYDTASFIETPPAAPVMPAMEPAPQQSQFKRAPLTLLTLINPRAMRRRREAAENKFQTAYDGWEYLKRWREGEHDKAMKLFRSANAEWEARKASFLDLQAKANARLDALREGYGRGEAEAVIGHCDLTLLGLERPENFPCFWSMRYSQGALELDYDLPSLAAIPVIKAVKYVPSRDVFEVVALSESERERIYGEAVFQTALAALSALFAADTADAVKSIVFKGWVNFVDTAGTHPGRACTLALAAEKRSFAALDLASVDPQACFRALNGTMSAKLEALVVKVAA